MRKQLLTALWAMAFIQTIFPTVEANSIQTPSVPTQAPIPNWFLKDVRIAAQTRFPVLASTYTLNWGEQPGVFYPQLNKLWFGVPVGKREEKLFPFNISAFYDDLLQQPKQYGPVSSINVLESVRLDSGFTIGRLTHAMSIYWANGMYLAFANGKVIINNNHSGDETYIVYPVKGITVPD